MIKINLMPVKRKAKPKPVPLFLVAMIALIIASAAAVVVWSETIKSEIDRLEKQKQANAEKIKELDAKVKEVQNFESLEAELTRRKEIIEQLTKNQSLPVRILDEMSGRLTDGVWIKSMAIGGNKLSLSGSGFKNTDIVTFVQSLKESEFFTNVNLLGTSRQMFGAVETYAFSMTVEVAQ